MGTLKYNIEDIKKECERISPAIIYHLEKLLESEEKYKLKHKKTIKHIKDIISKMKRIDETIRYQIKIYNKMNNLGMISQKETNE